VGEPQELLGDIFYRAAANLGAYSMLCDPPKLGYLDLSLFLSTVIAFAQVTQALVVPRIWQHGCSFQSL
jgi:hypothetical protein